MIPLLANQHDWGFVCGRVNILEGQMLPQSFYMGLLAQERWDDVLRQLQGLPLESTLTPDLAWDNWAATLEAYYMGMMLSLRANCPDPAVVDLFLLQGQYFNLKEAVLGGTSEYPPVVFPEKVLKQVAEGDFSALPEPAHGALTRFRAPVKAQEQPPALDPLLDATYLRHMLALAAATEAPLIIAYTERWVTSRVIILLWRARRMKLAPEAYLRELRPLGKLGELAHSLAGMADLNEWPAVAGSALGPLLDEAMQAAELRQIPLFEQRVAESLLHLAHRGRAQVFGPERVLSFLAEVSHELFNLKLAVTGRFKQLEIPALRQELRATYA